MKLWTKELEERAKKFPLRSQENLGMEATVLVKYFNPYGAGTWIATEAVKQPDGDWMFFGYCHIFEWEWGYFTLSELKKLYINLSGYVVPMIERELHIKDDATVADCSKY